MRSLVDYTPKENNQRAQSSKLADKLNYSAKLLSIVWNQLIFWSTGVFFLVLLFPGLAWSKIW